MFFGYHQEVHGRTFRTGTDRIENNRFPGLMNSLQNNSLPPGK